MKIVYAFACGLAIIAIMTLLKINGGILAIISIIIGTFVLFYSAYIYSDINRRDNVYFDELSFNSASSNNNGGSSNVDVSGNMSVSSGGLFCLGSSCCANGTVWNSTNQLCTAIPEAFVNARPWSPNEYDSYTKI
jgi:hypothetical protein